MSSKQHSCAYDALLSNTPSELGRATNEVADPTVAKGEGTKQPHKVNPSPESAGKLVLTKTVLEPSLNNSNTNPPQISNMASFNTKKKGKTQSTHQNRAAGQERANTSSSSADSTSETTENVDSKQTEEVEPRQTSLLDLIRLIRPVYAAIFLVTAWTIFRHSMIIYDPSKYMETFQIESEKGVRLMSLSKILKELFYMSGMFDDTWSIFWIAALSRAYNAAFYWMDASYWMDGPPNLFIFEITELNVILHGMWLDYRLSDSRQAE